MSDQQPPILKVVDAAVATAVNPSLPMLAEDLVLVHNLVSEVKEKLAGKHESVRDVFRYLFSLQ